MVNKTIITVSRGKEKRIQIKIHAQEDLEILSYRFAIDKAMDLFDLVFGVDPTRVDIQEVDYEAEST